MAKFDPYSFSSKERDKILDEFYSIVTSLKNKEQTINFFKDLLTPSEAIMLTRRIQIAKLLLQGHDYREIAAKLKTGIDTVAKVQRWLKNGFGGYIKALERIVDEEEYRIRRKENIEASKEVNPNSLEGLANRYPLYWGLTNAIHKMVVGYGDRVGHRDEKDERRKVRKKTIRKMVKKN